MYKKLFMVFILVLILFTVTISASTAEVEANDCPNCGEYMRFSHYDGGNYTAMHNTCPRCGVYDERILVILEHIYECPNCHYSARLKIERFFECGCGCRFYP